MKSLAKETFFYGVGSVLPEAAQLVIVPLLGFCPSKDF